MVAMRKQWWVAAVLAWAGVVAVVALVAWWVIDGAGEDVLAEPPADVLTPGPADPDASSSEADGPESSDGPTATTDDPTTAPTTGPTTGPTSSAVPPPSEPPPTSPPPSGAPDQPGPQRRTSSWQGEAGLLRVSCTGPALRLEGASPSDGWVVDKNEQKGGSELEVRFRSADGDRRVEIEVACVDGVPDFNVELDD